MAVAEQRQIRRFTVDDYHRMGEIGILRSADCVGRSDWMTVAPNTRRFTVAEFYRMGEARIFGFEEQVELIGGPTPDGYTTFFIARRRDRIAPLAFPDREIEIG